MAAPDSGTGGEALEVFAGWLSRRENGELVGFDELVRDHPHLAAELTELQATKERLETASDPSNSTLALHEGIEGRSREASVRGISPGEESQARRDFSSALIARLSAHSRGFGRYRIRGEVGRGGMGAILKIWDEDLHRHLAMKVILGQAKGAASGAMPPAEATRVARFLEEARVTGQLDHPGIVPVHELGLDPEGRLYFTMKLVKGISLKEVFDLVAAGREGWTQTKALGVLLKVCEAMAYAHDKGVIHRDLKPANIMVGKFGEVHVMDWGLARILDRPDEKDIRICEEIPHSTELRSARDELHAQTPESPLYTMDGDVVGTPAYMPPEQAAGRLTEVGPHSDVYALGAMLYHLLAGHMPFVPKGARLNNYAVWGLVQQGPPTSIARLSPETPAELVAICDKAMTRDWQQRYRDMSELAADLSAYLEHRVVAAHETGTWAETKKWVERNKALATSLAAAIAILVAGIIGTSAFAVDARKQERIATERANDVLSLSAIQDLDGLIARADKLRPARPASIPKYEEWLRDARALVDGQSTVESGGIKAKPGLAEHKQNLAEVEQRALPQTAEERAAERASFPRAGELVQKRSRAEWMARMLGRSAWPSEAEVEDSVDHLTPAPADAQAWNAIARKLLLPDRVFGDEVKALVCARRAVDVANEKDRYTCRDTLALALLNLGRFEEALAEERRAVEEAPEKDHQAVEAQLEVMEGLMARWRTPSGEMQPARERERSELAAEVEALEQASTARREWSFADGEDRWWHAQLSRLVAGLEAFADPKSGLFSSGISPEHGWGIGKRLEFARTIEEVSVSGAEASQRWEEAIASIRDPMRCQQYAGLVMQPQIGLLPIGRDEESGLWEFAHLQTGDPAIRGADGRLVVGEGTGLVFVLIPAGTFWMGAQPTDPTGTNYDPQANAIESPVHEVSSSAYMLSKYEMTQGQWLRIAGSNPSAFGTSSYFKGHQHDLTHPVESVSWADCHELMEQLDLVLPGEAQWEFGCRGGTDTPWWTGSQRESLRGHANLADQAAKRGGATWIQIEDWPDLDDGWASHAPVGSMVANPYGLHEVHGNVYEWCLDGYGPYLAEEQVDPVRPWRGASFVVYRGGGLSDSAGYARSACRNNSLPGASGFNIGLRPARTLSVH